MKFDKLKELGYKPYANGYSKKAIGKPYDFIDISLEDRIVKTAVFVKDKFIYHNADKSDIPDLIKNKLVKEIKNG
ncbi:MAG: hypothetical protein K2G03_03390 [Bacilli bacterium]|nr:hypothetical protein [Bacilli bacterium]